MIAALTMIVGIGMSASAIPDFYWPAMPAGSASAVLGLYLGVRPSLIGPRRRCTRFALTDRRALVLSGSESDTLDPIDGHRSSSCVPATASTRP